MALLAELHEAEATGRIAEIYREIRTFCGVPYVSSLQRYLATLPGALEWAWDALRPALVSGTVQETGWRLAAGVRVGELEPPPPGARADWDAVRNIGANFLRVSPVNIVTGACLARLLRGDRPAGPGFPGGWEPPAMLPPMPGNVDPDTLPPDRRAVLMRFAQDLDGAPFVPALYRQIAHWPDALLWLADRLGPRFADPEVIAARAAFRAAAMAAAPGIVARLPGLPDGPAPDAATARRVLAAIDRYAETSPEMTMFGRLVIDACPAP
jgi:hypothetical protein